MFPIENTKAETSKRNVIAALTKHKDQAPLDLADDIQKIIAQPKAENLSKINFHSIKYNLFLTLTR